MRKVLLPTAVGAAASLLIVGALVAVGVFGKASNSAVEPASAAQRQPHALGGAAVIRKDRRFAPPTTQISALRKLPPLSHQPDGLGERLAALTNGAARIDAASVREAAPGVYLALRSDGLACLVSASGGMCPISMLEGGVALLPSSLRQGDQPNSPWLLSVGGLAIDGVSNVSLVFRGGTKSATMAVRNNVFELTLSGREASDLIGYTVDGRTYSLLAATS
jgi:hypothetical protein